MAYVYPFLILVKKYFPKFCQNILRQILPKCSSPNFFKNYFAKFGQKIIRQIWSKKYFAKLRQKIRHQISLK